MTTITKLLEEYRNGSADACEEILKRMMPLAKKYAGKIHCMDYEDAKAAWSRIEQLFQQQ